MLLCPQKEQELVDGYIREQIYNVIPVDINDIVFKYYKNQHYFQWIGKEEMKKFVNTKEFKGIEFKIPHVEGVKLNFAIFTTDQVEFKLRIVVNRNLIHRITLNITLCVPEGKTYYCRTFSRFGSGYLGANNLIKLSECVNLKRVTFIGKLQVLSVVKTNREKIIFVQDIKINRKIQFVWDMGNPVEIRMNNNEIYSTYFGHSNNWMLLMNSGTNRLYLRLMKLPSNVKEICISVSISSLNGYSCLIYLSYTYYII